VRRQEPETAIYGTAEEDKADTIESSEDQSNWRWVSLHVPS
jgi:hypothetical protein